MAPSPLTFKPFDDFEYQIWSGVRMPDPHYAEFPVELAEGTQVIGTVIEDGGVYELQVLDEELDPTVYSCSLTGRIPREDFSAVFALFFDAGVLKPDMRPELFSALFDKN